MSDETTSEITDPGSLVNLSGVWFFHDGDSPMFARPNLDDRSWLPLRVPTERVKNDRRWQGRGWYRRHLYVDSRVLGNDLMLSVGPAREVVEVYVNGSLVLQRGHFGSRLRGETRVLPLQGLIPNGFLRAGENVIAIRVDDPSYTCGLPSGPLLLGPPDAVLQRTAVAGTLALATRLCLALVALSIALSQILTHLGRRAPRGEPWWAAGAGLSLAVMHLAGTGVITAMVPSLELAVRLPVTAEFTALLCLSGYFAARYDDFDSRLAGAGRFLMVVVSALVFLAPEKYVFLAAQPTAVVCALVTTLYSAHLLSQAARRQEPGALPVFAALLGLMALLVYDGMVPNDSDLLPPWAAMGGVGVLGLTCIVAARIGHAEHENTLLKMLRLQKQLDSRVWMDILAATASAITRPQEFLDAVAHEIARQMQVRRCSFIMVNGRNELIIVACKGLPRQARHRLVGQGPSIARFVCDTGLSLTPATLPAELLKGEEQQRQNNYDTNGFIAQPVRVGTTTLGVLNISDRNNGGIFTADDEVAMAGFAERLALVLQRLDVQVEELLSHEPPAPPPVILRPAAEPKGKPVEAELAAAIVESARTTVRRDLS